MSVKKNFATLLKKLSQDPALKAAMEQLRKSSAPGQADLWQALLIASRFANRRKTRAIADFIDIAMFLISLSLLIKQNVFDRPEVREFFAKSWKGASSSVSGYYETVRDFVSARLKKK
jgi:hypothetical protein